MIQNTIFDKNTIQNFNDDIMTKNNVNLTFNQKDNKQNQSKDKLDNDLSNSHTSISSNKDTYNHFVSKLKLNYHLKNPQSHIQTIILHKSLDKSISDLNESLNQDEINNESKFDNCFKNKNLNYDNNNSISNITGKEYEQLNNGFILDNSPQYSHDTNGLNQNCSNEKRNTINYINKLYEEENKKIIDDGNSKNPPRNIKNDNLTINFNNNMFLVNDNNKKPKKLSLKVIFSNSKKKEDSLNEKVFIPKNAFEDSDPTQLEKNDKNKNDLIKYNPNNVFCPKIQNNLNPLNSNNNNLNDLSTNQNSNNDNYNDGKNNNKNNYISHFNPGNNNPSVNFLQNSGNLLPELNNNQNNKNKKPNQSNQTNLETNFNHINYPNFIDKNNEKDIMYNSNIFPKKQNNQTFPNIDNNNNDLYKNDPNNTNPNMNLSNPKNFSPYKEYPLKLEDNLNQEQKLPNNIYDNNNNNIYDINNPDKDNLNLNKMNPQYSDMNNNINNNDYQNKIGYYPLDVNTKDENNNDNSQEIIVNDYENNSLRTSFDNIEILELEKNKNYNKGNNFLKSLIYGILFGSTTTCLIWLRNEETRKYLWEKYANINIDSIINLFKSLLNPFEFFRKIFNEDKRQVYIKVLGLTFGKFYDFLEKYGDGFRLIGLFLSIYTIWLIIKSLIKLVLKTQKQNKKN